MDIRLALLLLASLAGGAANALAGGGTFLVFPALLLAGVAPISANATASLILWPGGVASAWVYRRGMGSRYRFLAVMVAASGLGSMLGSYLLLSTSNSLFSSLVPWLMLIATTLFTFAGRLRQLAGSRAAHLSEIVLVCGQFGISVYGGFFGAGMGVLMLALYLATVNMDVHASNSLRTLCGAAINAVAVVVFALRGAIDWHIGIPMLVVAIAGGYVGALAVRRLNGEVARRAILTYAWTVTAWFFVRSLFFV